MNEYTPLLLDTPVDKKKPSPWYIIIPLFFLTFSFGALYAPIIQFVTVVFCYKYYQKNEIDGGLGDCAIPEVQALASEAQAIIMFLTYTFTLIFAGYYGSLSDRKGRRYILMTSTIGNTIVVITYILTYKYPEFFGVSLLFIAPIIQGCLGGNTVLIAAAQAYISDCTTPASRTIAFGHMLSSIYMGTTLGPTVGSIILKQTDSLLSIFYMALVVSSLFVCYVYFLLPESNDGCTSKKAAEEAAKTKEQTFLQRINVFSALTILVKTSPSHGHRYTLLIITAIEFCLALVAMPPSMLYAMLKFHWTAYEGGFYTSIVSFIRLMTTLLILPMIAKLFHLRRNKQESLVMVETAENVIGESSIPVGSSVTEDGQVETEQIPSEKDAKTSVLLDSWLIRTGLAFELFGFIAIGLAATSTWFTLAGAVHSFALLATPSLRSLLTSLVVPSDIGQLLGAMSVVESVAMIISQLSMNTIYSASVKTMPELVFFICAIVAGLALVLSFFINPSRK